MINKKLMLDKCEMDSKFTKENSTEDKTSVVENFFYFIERGKFLICDLEYCQESERTIDLKLFDLANNESLLNKLGLYFIQGNYGVTYTYESRAKWFCGYLSSFSIMNGDRDSKYIKSLKNPMVRILIEDESLLKKIKI